MSHILTALESRHSQYNLSDVTKLSDQSIVELIEKVTVAVPSAFNSQSQMVVVLFGKEHDKLWEIVREALRKVAVSLEAFEKTSAKIDSFVSAHGTVLYFDDAAITDSLVQQFPLYKDSFPVWAQQSLGMLQLSVWTALSEEGLGASIQHYNPLIDDEVHKAFGIAKSWKLSAQMPFGDIVSPTTGNSERNSASERVKVVGL